MGFRPTPTAGFGPFTLRLETGELFKNGAPIPLQSQPARLLVVLVTRAGDVVTRDEIRTRLWGDTVVSYDQGINYCIRQIRVALGDDAPAMLQTLPRRGYRFVMPATPRGRWRGSRAVELMRPIVLPLTVGVIVGLAIGSGSRRPEPRAAAPVEWRTDLTRWPVATVAWWRLVRGHLTGEANCPYLRFLRPNSSSTHRTS